MKSLRVYRQGGLFRSRRDIRWTQRISLRQSTGPTGRSPTYAGNSGTARAVKREHVGCLAPSEPSLWVMAGGQRRQRSRCGTAEMGRQDSVPCCHAPWWPKFADFNLINWEIYFIFDRSAGNWVRHQGKVGRDGFSRVQTPSGSFHTRLVGIAHKWCRY